MSVTGCNGQFVCPLFGLRTLTRKPLVEFKSNLVYVFHVTRRRLGLILAYVDQKNPVAKYKFSFCMLT